MKLGELVKRKRLQMHMTQQALAKQVGVHGVYITVIEQGERVPSMTILVAIAKVLQLNALELVLAAHPCLARSVERQEIETELAC